MRFFLALFFYLLFFNSILNGQAKYTIHYKMYRIFSDTVKYGAGSDIVLVINDTQSYTYYPSGNSYSDFFPLGKSFIAKSTYFNVNRKLLIDPYAYPGSPKTEALIIYENPDNEWKIENEKKVILGDTCIKAIGKVSGVDVVAWYSPKLPAGFGIHHNVGLPGTILETLMVHNNIQSVAIKIENSAPDIIEPTYFRRVKRKTYLARRNNTGNPKINWKEKDFID